MKKLYILILLFLMGIFISQNVNAWSENKFNNTYNISSFETDDDGWTNTGFSRVTDWNSDFSYSEKATSCTGTSLMLSLNFSKFNYVAVDYNYSGTNQTKGWVINPTCTTGGSVIQYFFPNLDTRTNGIVKNQLLNTSSYSGVQCLEVGSSCFTIGTGGSFNYLYLDNIRLMTDSDYQAVFNSSSNITRYLSIPQNVVLTHGFINLSGSKSYFNSSSKSLEIDNTFITNGYSDARLGQRINITNKTIQSISFKIARYNSTSSIDFNFSIRNTSTDAIVETNHCDDCSTLTPNLYEWKKVNFNNTYINQEVYILVEVPIRMRISSTDISTGENLVSYNAGYTDLGYDSNYRIEFVNDSSDITNPILYIGSNKGFNQTGIFNTTNKTSNLANLINSYVNTCTFLNGFCQVPFKFYSDTAGVIDYNNFIFDNKDFYENGIIYSPTTSSGTLESFKLNITYDPNYYTSISANLIYNGTSYPSSVTLNNSYTIFSNNINVPVVTSTTNYSFYWNITLINSTSTTYLSSSTNNQTVSNISFGLCNSVNNITYLNFTIKNAESPYNLINATFKSTWYIGNTSYNNYSYQDLNENVSSFAFCISPSNVNYTITSIIEYDNVNYAKNFYYLSSAIVTNTSQNITLYLLNDSKATITQVWSRDTAQKPVTDVIFNIQAYDVGTDTYYTVAMAKSGEDGKDIVYLNWYDTLYKMILTKNGTVLKTSKPFKIAATPVSFDIIPTNLFPYDKFDTLVYSLTFNNVTNNYILTFTDPTGLVSAGCLKVIKRSTLNDTIICNTCESSSSATIYCNIASYGNGTYIGSFYALGSFAPIESLETLIGFSNSIYDALGNLDASIYAFIFSGIVICMFLVTPVLGIIGALLGMILSVALGFQPVDTGIYVAISVIGGIVIWILKR